MQIAKLNKHPKFIKTVLQRHICSELWFHIKPCLDTNGVFGCGKKMKRKKEMRKSERREK